MSILECSLSPGFHIVESLALASISSKPHLGCFIILKFSFTSVPASCGVGARRGSSSAPPFEVTRLGYFNFFCELS
jgi:hypothetical protein